MTAVSVLNLLFLCQHIWLHPFHSKASNKAEALSLCLLTIASIINLLKASLTDSGIVPTGPSVSFFKGIEFAEKMFPIVLIVYIIFLQIRRNRSKQTVKLIYCESNARNDIF